MRLKTSILVGKLRKGGAFEVIETTEKNDHKLQKEFHKADPEKYTFVGVIRNPRIFRRRHLFTAEEMKAKQKANAEATKAAGMQAVTAAEQNALDLERQAKNARKNVEGLKHRHGLKKTDVTKAEETAKDNLPPASRPATPPTPAEEPKVPVPTTPPESLKESGGNTTTDASSSSSTTTPPASTSTPAASSAPGATTTVTKPASAAKAAGAKAAAKKKAKAKKPAETK